MTFNKYYQHELQHLRELAKEFAQKHPAIAPMLIGPTSDPDTERLLEGVAFLTGLLRQKIDDDFPEIIHGLTDILFPHYLKAVPAMSIVTFRPKAGLQETLHVPRGVSLASLPVEGTECIFKTCFDLEIHPARLIDARLSTPEGKVHELILTLELTAGQLDKWELDRLSFFIGGQYAQAADLFILLHRYCRGIILRPHEGGQSCHLAAGYLKPVGLSSDNTLLPFPSQALSGYRLLQEFFVLPQKFLFCELHGWDQWTNRGQGNKVDIIFSLDHPPFSFPKVNPGDFHLYTTPVINLFTHKAEPILLDHYHEKVRVVPSRTGDFNHQIYSIDRVIGYSQGQVKKKEYQPLTMFSGKRSEAIMYQIYRSLSPVDNVPEVYISFSYPSNIVDFKRETLAIDLTCTNGNIPEKLQHGDICRQTSDSPELLEFHNIIPPTIPIDPMIEGEALWTFLSHLALNIQSLAQPGNLKKLLKLYIYEGRDKTRASANLKRLEGIEDLRVRPVDRFVAGLMMRGQELRLTTRMDNFASIGDLLLFGSVLDIFLSEFSSLNTFTRFILDETITGESFTWPERLGERTLI